MNETQRSKLLNIKDHLELDKDLKIKDLEKENAFLLIQVNKYKKRQVVEVGNNEIFERANAKIKKIKKAHSEHCLNITKAKNKYRDLMIKEMNMRKFIEKMIKNKFGSDAFIEIMNHIDNPDKARNFPTIERQDRFKEAREVYLNELKK
jgi:hypothetical protein